MFCEIHRVRENDKIKSEKKRGFDPELLAKIDQRLDLVFPEMEEEEITRRNNNWMDERVRIF